MTFKAAMLKWCQEAREHRVECWQADLRRIRQDIRRLEECGDEDLVRRMAPFDQEGACRPGAAIWDAEDAAKAIAEATREPVSFVHNEQRTVVLP